MAKKRTQPTTENIKLLRTNGEELDMTSYKEVMLTNLQKKRGIFDMTPIGEKADGTYFFCEDIDSYFDLDTSSVKKMVKDLKAGVC